MRHINPRNNFLKIIIIDMYIRQIVIDGFKSYAQRTEIGPFDSQFNAITGLNGSGKSNILDSVCFLLGISNLSQVCLVLYIDLYLYIYTHLLCV